MDRATVYQLLGLLVSVATTLLGVWAYQRRRQVDVAATREEVAVKEQAAPVLLLTQQLERQHQEGMAQRAQTQQIITGMLANDRADRAALIKTLAAIEASLQALQATTAAGQEALKDELVEHRTEERAREASMHARFNHLDRAIARRPGADA